LIILIWVNDLAPIIWKKSRIPDVLGLLVISMTGFGPEMSPFEPAADFDRTRETNFEVSFSYPVT